MSLNEKQIKEIAFLARVNVCDSEIEKTTSDVNNILALMADLAKINTEEIQPMSHPIDMCQRLREDDVIEKDESKKLQKIAPNTDNGYFLVPKVIE